MGRHLPVWLLAEESRLLLFTQPMPIFYMLVLPMVVFTELQMAGPTGRRFLMPPNRWLLAPLPWHHPIRLSYTLEQEKHIFLQTVMRESVFTGLIMPMRLPPLLGQSILPSVEQLLSLAD